MSRFPPNIAASAIRWIGNVERLRPLDSPRYVAAACRAIIDRAMVLSVAARFNPQPVIDRLLRTSLEHLAEGDTLLLALSKLPATVAEYEETLPPLAPKDFK